MIKSMPETIKLTNEYASNLSCALIDFTSQEYLYIDLFSRIFHNCIFIKSEAVKNNKINMAVATVDLILVSINDDCQCDEYDQLKNKIDSFRRTDDTIPVLALNNIKHNEKLNEVLKGSYVVDGIIPSPFYKYGLYRFLYRMLKRITHVKELEAYIRSLEKELSFEAPKELGIKPPKKNEIQQIDKEREKDIRFTQLEKISAVDFMASLDNTIVDKMELLFEHLDNFITTLYDFETFDVQNAYNLLPAIKEQINEVYIIIDSLSVFSVSARAFNSLSELLNRITLQDLQDTDKKNMFCTMLIAIVNDLEKWIKVIFVEQSTQDIHYFDASFSSNILEIESIFTCNDEEDEDFEDDLEFF
ncbi:hypothetical protein [Sulfurimonas sp.]